MHRSTRPLFVRWGGDGQRLSTAERRALKDLARTTGRNIRTNFAGRHQVHLPRNLGLDEPPGVALVVVDAPRSRSTFAGTPTEADIDGLWVCRIELNYASAWRSRLR
jgi:hypothetical protein